MTRKSPATRAFTGVMGRLARDRSGNTLVMVAAAIGPILAMVGSGIDMGRSYLSETRLQQACDAGVLAARKKLGSSAAVTGVVPAAVETVGNKFFNVNFRAGAYGTENRNFVMTLEDDYSISGVAKADVPTTIMKIFGYNNVPVEVHCEAKLNFSNTDIMMVLDTTGSMRDKIAGTPKIDALKDVVHSFHAQMEASKGPGTRIRYGFVPYSSNVNVGPLLKDEWVVDNWTYQSREQTGSIAGDPYTYWDNFVWKSGTYTSATTSSYPATYHAAGSETGGAWYSCDTSPPAGSLTNDDIILSTVSEPYVGPPIGTKTTEHHRRTINGSTYWISLSGTTCEIIRGDYATYIDEYDRITIPSNKSLYLYHPIARDVHNWRSESNGCIEERATTEITDYSNVDFNQNKDLDIDTVPTSGQPATQWRPMYPNEVYERSLDYYGSGSFTEADVTTPDSYFHPYSQGFAPCPAPSRKLAEMDSTGIDSFLGTLNAAGSTYHDIGMIWGGRLLSPTGLFAAENADQSGKPTSRHLIFLTDGQTQPLDINYSSYGVEPLDKRRWSPSSAMTLKQVVEARFTVACSEVKKRNITVWVIAFGTNMSPMFSDCAGAGHYFQADDADALNDIFSKIAAAMGDLRVSK